MGWECGETRWETDHSRGYATCKPHCHAISWTGPFGLHFALSFLNYTRNTRNRTYIPSYSSFDFPDFHGPTSSGHIVPSTSSILHLLKVASHSQHPSAQQTSTMVTELFGHAITLGQVEITTGPVVETTVFHSESHPRHIPHIQNTSLTI